MFKDEYLLDFINTENLGQLCTYLQALDLTVKKPHENPSIGIVLCKEMNKASLATLYYICSHFLVL